MDEWIDIIDEQGKPSGKIISKEEAHLQGTLHRTVHIWIVNNQNEVLLQKRHPQKDTFPNLWDVSVAGHIEAGEFPLDAAIREVKEELGLDITTDMLKFTGLYNCIVQHAETLIDNELHHIYLLRTTLNLQTLKLQKSEVTAVQFFDLKTFEKMQTKPKSHHIVPLDKAYLDLILKRLKSNLES
ncbi:MAG: NUDIX domain-containing protein [Flavobacteriaceae bacterium]|nr:NUDIX domain-containing protein [Flavobacteriaceae bacterium]